MSTIVHEINPKEFIEHAAKSSEQAVCAQSEMYSDCARA